jgi:CARDB
VRKKTLALALAFLGLGLAAASLVALGKSTKPKLRVTFVRSAASSVTAGRQLRVTYDVRNVGHARAPRSTLRLYLRGRSTVTLARRSVPRLGAGRLLRGRTNATVRSSLAAGNYRLQACVRLHHATRCRTAKRAILVLRSGRSPVGQPPSPLTGGWRPTRGFAPLSDAQAAARVQAVPENRPENTSANNYVPSPSELHEFYVARNDQGQTSVQRDPYLAYVTGGYAGTTDEIIQWAAWKWGIPADWLRAQYVTESHWHQAGLGDLTDVGVANVTKYPPQSRETQNGQYTGRVWQSLGISQIKWKDDGSDGAGTEPLRWKSTAFAADYQAATVRWYYDDPSGTRSAWGDDSYAPGNEWLSIGGWYEPYPWNNSSQRGYIADVQQELADRSWAKPGF